MIIWGLVAFLASGWIACEVMESAVRRRKDRHIVTLKGEVEAWKLSYNHIRENSAIITQQWDCEHDLREKAESQVKALLVTNAELDNKWAADYEALTRQLMEVTPKRGNNGRFTAKYDTNSQTPKAA